MDHNSDQMMISLGFSDEKVPAGSHICQIYSDKEEAISSLLHFLLSSIQTRERAACFSEKIDETMLRDCFETHGLAYDECNPQNDRFVFGTSDTYFENTTFDPDRILEALADYHRESLNLGYQAFRVIGEMDQKVQSISGGDRLLEYEAKVSLLAKKQPITAVCQYNANEFDGATIMEILKVHPQMMVKGTVIHNPFFIPPEDVLRKNGI